MRNNLNITEVVTCQVIYSCVLTEIEMKTTDTLNETIIGIFVMLLWFSLGIHIHTFLE